uniref:Uncharacterized protein n=1 Tax=Peronospora matthiolae TaxID=2874970 RepID=A0AAV1VEQ1_9STRA
MCLQKRSSSRLCKCKGHVDSFARYFAALAQETSLRGGKRLCASGRVESTQLQEFSRIAFTAVVNRCIAPL